MHMVVFMMSLKRFFRDGEKKEEASEYYKRHIRMLHYGNRKAARETEHADRKKEKNPQERSKSNRLQKMRRNHEESR